MAHYFLSGRLRTDPILREYLDNLERGPVTQDVPTPELVIATETITQNAPPELIYVTETVVQDVVSFYTVPPELIYLTETITQHAPPSLKLLLKIMYRFPLLQQS
jgi:hypothetical protein